jgi:hypothetical protein
MACVRYLCIALEETYHERQEIEVFTPFVCQVGSKRNSAELGDHSEESASGRAQMTFY